MLRKILAIGSLVSMMLFVPSTVQAQEDVILIVEDEIVAFDQVGAAPILKDERLYVPLRVVSQSLGYHVNWSPQSRAVTIFTETPTQLVLDEVDEYADARIFINGSLLEIESDLGSAFLSEHGFTMIPLRAVGEALNCHITWEDSVVIVSKILKEITQDNSTSQEQQLSNTYYSLSIFGDSIATVEQINQFLEERTPAIRSMLERSYPHLTFQEYPKDIAKLYIEIGRKYNIRGDLAFAQALKETGYFQFYGSVKPFQNNFCGLGATGLEITGEESLNGVDPSKAYFIPGTHGITFATVEAGVEAHIQHLYAYATRQPLPDNVELLDPRFKYVSGSIAHRWIDLNGRWAVPGNGYGESIIDSYWQPMLNN